MALLLEHGVRADQRAAARLVAARDLRYLGVADFQHRIELLHMYGCSLQAPVHVIEWGLQSKLLPLLAFLDKHKCASSLPFSSF